MAAHLHWFYDALVIGILLIFIYIGARNGFMKRLVFMVLVIASLVVSWLGAEIAAPIIYDEFIKEQVSASLNKNSKDTDPTEIAFEAISEGDYGVEVTDTEVSGIMSESGDFFDNVATEIKKNGSVSDTDVIKSEVEESMISKMLTSLLGSRVSEASLKEMLVSIEGTTEGINNVLGIFVGGDSEATAQAAEEKLVAPVVKGLLKIVIWLLLVIIFRLIIEPVSDSFKSVNKIPLIGPVNSLLGAILGAVEGAILISVISVAVKLAVYLTKGSLIFINNETISQTYLFKLFYELDLSTFI